MSSQSRPPAQPRPIQPVPEDKPWPMLTWIIVGGACFAGGVFFGLVLAFSTRGSLAEQAKTIKELQEQLAAQDKQIEKQATGRRKFCKQK